MPRHAEPAKRQPRSSGKAAKANSLTPKAKLKQSVGAKKPVGATPAPDRREAILAAALHEFSERGFAGTRLDDVARRAGVAKGTIYLYFSDKEVLFQDLIRSALGPVVAMVEAADVSHLPLRVVMERLSQTLVRDVFGSPRKNVIRLILTEGPRFPKLAEFYYREVISRIMAAMRELLKAAIARGEIDHAALVEFPQLIGAPLVLAVMWDALFSRWAPLDIEKLLKTNMDILFAGSRP